MAMKTILVTVLSIGMLSTVSGCGTVAGAAGSAIAGQAASGMLASGGNKARFSRQSCDELQREIAGAQRSMMNPANIMYARSYIKDARTVAIDKNCPFVQAEAAAETETESDQES
ncbi:MAG TPA: hypothetical protein EYG02_05945 [Henriciella marina]|uniref:hypothetical protein n=1 Tax=Henriciella sp. TaxID=1968823 RepID=UPI00183E5AA0|nr:hypothetical protein [Henriciella sp.]HIG23211.1 hypothetical protein [Henriciella sp.]HIK64556.1 hypothetical protein [Henriciella marina]